MRLLRWIVTRLVVFVVSLALASVLIFIISEALPGDAATVMLGQGASPEAVEALRQQLGIDRPGPVRYFEWVGGMLTGDYGTSLLTRRPVAEQIGMKFPVTFWLVFWGMVAALVLAVPVGMVAALRRRHIEGFAASGLSQIGLAIPAFWAGIIGIYVFAVQLRWFPANGYVPFWSSPVQWLRHLVLPVLSLAIVQAAVIARYVRSAIIEVLAEDYYRTARAIGWRQFPALIRHGLRNASLSVVTVLGLQFSTLFVGAIVIESVFTLPGLGSMLLQAVSQRDMIVVQGTVMLLVFIVLVINALVDLSYVALDPRLRARGAR
ncbi:ABC transporter permease [Granulicoccus sp. GXG6511]|uniref:ABC transporter permease n=1 Tax=Granulicoccus sp. GXG6511 TaxID=3381351 RepID=UPI003D7CE7EF